MLKKADLTTKLTPGSAINLVNPFSTFAGGATWAPKSIANSPSNNKDREVVYKAVTGFLGAAALAAAVRGYMATQQSSSREFTKDIKDLPRPTTDAPFGAVEMAEARKGELTDPETDLDSLAMALPGAVSGAYRGARKGVKALGAAGEKLVRGIGKGASDGRWAQLALPVAGMSAGALLGYNLVDTAVEGIDKTKLTAETAKKEALLRRLVAARALNARGMLDDNTYGKMMTQVAPYMPSESVVKTASVKSAGAFEEPVGRLYGLAGMLLATSFAVSAYITKRQTDANDPARVKMKAYQEGLKQYANERMMQAPVITGNPDQSVLEMLDNTPEVAVRPATSFAPNSPVSVAL